jgi:hypothetical protein
MCCPPDRVGMWPLGVVCPRLSAQLICYLCAVKRAQSHSGSAERDERMSEMGFEAEARGEERGNGGIRKKGGKGQGVVQLVHTPTNWGGGTRGFRGAR